MAAKEKKEFKPITVNTTPKIRTSRFSPALTKRQHFSIMPETKHTVEDTLQPEYWAHVARQVNSNAKIEAFWEDGSKYAEYIVTSCHDTGLAVVLLTEVDLTTAKATKQEEATEDYLVKFVNHHVGWVVIRTADNNQISKNHKSRDDAENWLARHSKQIGS